MKRKIFCSITLLLATLQEKTSLVSSTENDLVCYQCQSESVSECRRSKYLKACPNDQAYDRCETIIRKVGPHENATVTKKCSLAPCNLDDDALGFARQCDVSKDSYVCSSCCKENACNAGADNKNHATCVTNVLLVTLVLPKMAQSCFLSGSPSLRPG